MVIQTNTLKNIAFLAILFYSSSKADDDDGDSSMVKMCLHYGSPIGHARSDPILNQECASDHVHTFYGPANFHPDTSYEQLRDSQPRFSSSPFEENQSLYWHPSIYEVTGSGDNEVYTRVSDFETSSYYRWDMIKNPETVAFPPGFRMIAYSNQEGTDGIGDYGKGGTLYVECCNFLNNVFDGSAENEECDFAYGNPLVFPKKACDFLGIALSMPTCWDESKGIGIDDPFGHVAYTTDAKVTGSCPDGYDTRLPQLQLFLRIDNYRGDIKTYQLSDESDIFHVDFMNGWEEGTFQMILDECEPNDDPGYNPDCSCDDLLTVSENPVGSVCDDDVKEYILDEETEVVSGELPRGTCGLMSEEKSWDVDPPFKCFNEILFQDDDEDDDEEEDDDSEMSETSSLCDGDDDGGEEKNLTRSIGTLFSVLQSIFL